MTKFNIYFYKTISGKEIILDSIDSFNLEVKTKVRNGIRLLEEYGLSLLNSHWIKKVYKNPPIYELRIKSQVEVRLLFTFIYPNNFLITNIFVKKTNKLPGKELDTAIKRVKEFR